VSGLSCLENHAHVAVATRVAANQSYRSLVALVLATIIISVMSAMTVAAFISPLITRMFLVQVVTFEAFYCVMVTVPIGPLSTFGERSTVSASRVVASINMAAEVILAVIPRSCADKHAI